MRKLVLAVCSVFVLSSLSFADPGGIFGYKDKETKEEKEARRAKMESIKQDHMEFKKNMDKLIEKYNKANETKKDEIKKEIRDLVAAKTDKDIVAKKDMLEDQKSRILKLETKISDLEVNKDKYIDERVEYITSAEGQAKMKEMCDKKERTDKEGHDKDSKKDKKGDKQSKKHK